MMKMKLLRRRVSWIAKHKNILAACMLLYLTLCIFIYKIHNAINEDLFVSENAPEDDRHKFSIYTNGCKINKLDPMDASIRDYVTSPSAPLTCDGGDVNIVHQDGHWLRFNRSAVATFVNFSHCAYKALIRLGDNLYNYKEDIGHLYEDVVITDELIKVACFNNQHQEIYAKLFAYILSEQNNKRQRVREKAFKEYLQTRKPLETFNIVMIGVDSMSRSNFIRQMPKTITYLKNDLQAIDFHGYNKVGDNTFPNIVPMLTGKSVQDLFWSDERVRNMSYDKYPFLWKDFSAAGYSTLFAEDSPQIAIFNYLKAGFNTKPTDYYARPFFLALEKEQIRTQRHCLGNKEDTKRVLDYLWDAMQTFRTSKTPHFSFAFITHLTHDSINDASLGDHLYESFFKKFESEGHRNNTILFFFSDHGIRFGDIRLTNVGKFEERLPGMFVVVPSWFHHRYPEFSKNLHVNSRRLVTPFDIYETIKSTLGFSEQIKEAGIKQRGISLFREIPDNRTCSDAGIPSHYCTCHETSQMNVSDVNVQSAGKAALAEINRLIRGYRGICAELKLKEIIKADKVMQMFQTDITYQVTFKVTPSEAIFESSVIWSSSQRQQHILIDVSRINRYGDQSHCVDNQSLKKFCFCVN